MATGEGEEKRRIETFYTPFEINLVSYTACTECVCVNVCIHEYLFTKHGLDDA